MKFKYIIDPITNTKGFFPLSLNHFNAIPAYLLPHDILEHNLLIESFKDPDCKYEIEAAGRMYFIRAKSNFWSKNLDKDNRALTDLEHIGEVFEYTYYFFKGLTNLNNNLKVDFQDDLRLKYLMDQEVKEDLQQILKYALTQIYKNHPNTDKKELSDFFLKLLKYFLKGIEEAQKLYKTSSNALEIYMDLKRKLEEIEESIQIDDIVSIHLNKGKYEVLKCLNY